jgi:hypothetical protein
MPAIAAPPSGSDKLLIEGGEVAYSFQWNDAAFFQNVLHCADWNHDSAVHPENVVGVVVALGHNDANEGLPDSARFAAAWQQTLALLRARFGAVTVVVVAPAFDDAPPAVDRAGVLRPAFVGDGVVVVDEPPMDTSLGLGCVWHPGTAAQSAFARQLLPPIARALGR